MSRLSRRLLPLVLGLAVFPIAALPSDVAPAAEVAEAADYRNPLAPSMGGGGVVDSCADPTVLRGQRADDGWWYMYCTTNPLHDDDTNAAGRPVFHPIPTMRSQDLVNWEYVGDALLDPPSWAAQGARFWAPDVVYSTTHDLYYLTFVVTDVVDAVSGAPNCARDTAIGVATSREPSGPWKVSDTPVVAPRRRSPGCHFFGNLDPDVLGDRVSETGFLYHGSFNGGMFGQRIRLTRNGMRTTGSPTRLAVADRYEAPNVVRRGAWYYLFASATPCCNGPLTGYGVFAGRSRKPLGPFVDRAGNSFLASRVGGTPVLSMNGNRWVGTGHNSVLRDFGGQWWTVYHAIDRFVPYFESRPGVNIRSPMLDPVDWVDGWPSVRANRGASDESMPGPAAQPGEGTTYLPDALSNDRPGARRGAFSDEFNDTTLNGRWSWVRRPRAAGYDEQRGVLRVDTGPGTMEENSNNPSVLVRGAPNRDYVVETRVKLNLPPRGCCFDHVQAGLVIYGGDDRFVKLTHTSVRGTRQVRFAKEIPQEPAPGAPRLGINAVGPPANWTRLRIFHQAGDAGQEDRFTAYSRQGGKSWIRGGTWRHELGDGARIGLVSMGGRGFTARFDYVRVSSVEPGG